MTKQLYVSSAVQAALLTEVLIPEFSVGFWQNHRPADHAAQWKDVQIIVTTDGTLGPINFKVPRLYNFVNPDFIKPNEDKLVACAQSIKSSSNFRSVKKELIELSRIVGGRLADQSAAPLKANRGNNKATSTTEGVAQAKAAVAKAGGEVKRTAVKKTATEVQKAAPGTVVRRVAVVRTETAE